MPFTGGVSRQVDFNRIANGHVSFEGSSSTQNSFFKSVYGTISGVGSVALKRLFKRNIAGELGADGHVETTSIFKRSLQGVLGFSSDISRLLSLYRNVVGNISFTGLAQGAADATASLFGNMGSLVSVVATKLFAKRSLAGEINNSGEVVSKSVFHRGISGVLGFTGGAASKFYVSLNAVLSGMAGNISCLKNIVKTIWAKNPWINNPWINNPWK